MNIDLKQVQPTGLEADCGCGGWAPVVVLYGRPIFFSHKSGRKKCKEVGHEVPAGARVRPYQPKGPSA